MTGSGNRDWGTGRSPLRPPRGGRGEIPVSRSRFPVSGFTLVELMIVVVIVGLMVGVATTKLDFMVPKYKLRGAAREVAGLLKQARSRAAGSGKDVYVEFDLPRGQYWVLVAFPKPSESGLENDPAALEYQPLLQQALPEGVKFVDVIQGEKDRYDSGVARLKVSPFGSSTHLIVNLRNADEREMSLRMNGLTGATSFQESRMEAGKILEDAGP